MTFVLMLCLLTNGQCAVIQDKFPDKATCDRALDASDLLEPKHGFTPRALVCIPQEVLDKVRARQKGRDA